MNTMAHEDLIGQIDVMKLVVDGFVTNLEVGYYEASLNKGQTIEERVLLELNELARGFKKICWDYALKDVKKGNEEE